MDEKIKKPRKDEIKSAAKHLRSEAAKLRNYANGHDDLALVHDEQRPESAVWLRKHARLIAAAPDLYAFACAYRESLTDRSEADFSAEEMEILDMADKAIAKATGGAQ